MPDRPKIASRTRWTVESAGILILSAQGNGELLTGLEAVVWDLITRGNGSQRVIEKLAVIGVISNDEAGKVVADCLRTWAANGWLTERTNRG